MIAGLNGLAHTDNQSRNDGQITQFFLSVIKTEEEKRLADSKNHRYEIRQEIEAEILTLFYETLNKD